jgi:epoxyqueuosine reductase
VDPAIKSRDDKAPSRDDKAPSRDDKAASQDDNSIISKKLISKYIYGKDYHTVLKKNLNEIGIILKNHLQEEFAYRPVTDSIPFFDRAHARKAGLGFVGKNTMVIRPGLGSFFFIATLLTTLPIEKLAKKAGKKNPIESLNCGACTKCLDACPTNALSKEYFLDANKCLSYLTIEHRNTVDEKYIPHFEKTIYGCDICQEVCPYNLVTSNFPLIKSFSERHKPFLFLTANMIASMTETQYEQWFGGTAATRAKYSGLVRNALYHLYAVSDPNLNDILASLENSKHSLIQKTTRQILSLLAKDIALT